MSELFLSFFNRAMAAGWLVIVAVVLRLFLKKGPKWVNCLLWALVGLRLVWPFSLQSVLSLLPSREVLPPEVLFDPTPEIQTGIAFMNTRINTSFTPAMTAAELTSVNPLQIWTWLAGWVWLFGVAVLLLWAVISWLRLRKQVAASVELDGLWFCDGLSSPFILGLFRPRIYVPSDLSREDLAHVLAHEQAHLARKDHWWKPLAYVLLALHWFQPLLWVGYVLLCRDIELACDEKVIQTLDLEAKKEYSKALLSCSVQRRSIAACPVAFGEVGVKHRVLSVLHYRKPAFWIVVICVALCIVAAVCFLTDPLGFRLDFELEDISQATTMDLRRNSGPDLWTLTDTQEEELWFRLRDLKKTRRGDVYGGFTPFYSLSVQLQDGQQLRVQGYDMGAEKVDLVWNNQVYQVQDTEFCTYLEQLCAGVDRVAAPNTALITETAYYTTECVYMNPLSSVRATEDSGCYYYAQNNAFVIGARRTMTQQVIGGIVWHWRELPWTDAEWNEKFWATPVDLSGYTDRKYQPLDEEHYLLQLDNELWLVEDHGDTRVGIWSIYRLQQAESLSQAQWMYMEGAGEPLVIQFDLEYDEVQLTCTGGALHGAYENVNDDVLHYYGDQILYWTAAKTELAADVAWDAVISFTGYRDGAELFFGKVNANLDRDGKVWVSGGALGGTGPKLEMERRDTLVRIYSEDTSETNPVAGRILELQPCEISGIALHNAAGQIDPEDLRMLLQESVESTEFHSWNSTVCWRFQAILTDGSSLTMDAGTEENLVWIRWNAADEPLCVRSEELYWMTRRCNDVEPAGVDEAGYALCRELVDEHLAYIPELPAGMTQNQVHKELTGLFLADNSERLNAQAWCMTVVWNVFPPEQVANLIAGGNRINSELQLLNANASEQYIIVVDGEPIGFVGWWFLMDRTLDELYDSKEQLIEAVQNDG